MLSSAYKHTNLTLINMVQALNPPQIKSSSSIAGENDEMENKESITGKWINYLCLVVIIKNSKLAPKPSFSLPNFEQLPNVIVLRSHHNATNTR